MSSTMRVLGWVVVLCLLPIGSATRADDFSLDQSRGTDTVYFRSTARLEFIEGKTTSISGGLRFDPAVANGPISGILRVDLRTLKTGIETRDGHMRDRHLHTDKYPYAYFELTSVEGLPDRLGSDTTYSATIRGWFYIHGGKRQMVAALDLRLVSRGGGIGRLELRTGFQIKLDDYQIDRPKALFFKLAETIEIDVIFRAYNDLPVPPILLPAWDALD